MKYVLFICHRQRRRSQMAQAFFERQAPEDVVAESAGSDPAHEWRLRNMLPRLIEDFEARPTPEEIRGRADAILDCYDDVPVRSHILALANRVAHDCLGHEHGDALTPA